MCAVLATKVYNVSDDIIKDVVSTFGGVEHRLEYVGNINGREVYNDSKSTNTESTKIALNSFNSPTILLMGGTDRGHSFDELETYMKNTKLVVAYGETKNRISDFCNKINIKCIICNNLVEATDIAYDNSIIGDIILSSVLPKAFRFIFIALIVPSSSLSNSSNIYLNALIFFSVKILSVSLGYRLQ